MAKKKDKTPQPAQKQAKGPSVATHPRAREHVRMAKALGGLGGFLLAAYFSIHAGVPPQQVGLRALAAGAAGFMLGWACSVTVWRHLALAELQALVERSQADKPEPSE